MIPIHRRRSIPWTLTTAWLLCSTLALAGKTQDDAARAAARTAGYEGVKAYQSGDMPTAVDKLGRAFNVVKVPTLGLWYARALVKTGNLVEAYERYQEVTRLEVKEGKVKEQQQAQSDAATESESLRPKIPTLTLTVKGASEGCAVTLDGAPVSMDLMGLATPVNPGAHRIQAKQGEELVEEKIQLAEGEKKAIELKLKSKTPSASDLNSKAASAPDSASSAGRASSTGTSGSSTQKTIGWIALGVGGVATAAGVVTGILVLSKRGQLDDSGGCKGTVCESTEHDQLSSYNQMRTVSTASFVVGVVGLGVGTTLLLTAPKPKESGVSAWLGVGSVGFKGNF